MKYAAYLLAAGISAVFLAKFSSLSPAEVNPLGRVERTGPIDVSGKAAPDTACLSINGDDPARTPLEEPAQQPLTAEASQESVWRAQACLRQPLSSDFKACFQAELEKASSIHAIADLIKEDICSQDVPFERRVQAVILALEHLQHGDQLGLIRLVDDYCPINRSKTVLVGAVEQIGVTDETLYLALRSELSVDTLFGQEGHEALVSVAGNLVRTQDDGDLRGILTEGALGNLGGSADVVREAVVQTLSSATKGNDVVELCQLTKSSPNRPLSEGADENIGAHLAAHLMMDQTSSRATVGELIYTLVDLCDDPYWGVGAAAQVIAYRTRSEAPEGIDESSWEQVWDHARMVYQLAEGS